MSEEQLLTSNISESSASSYIQRERPSECKICRRPGHGHHYGVASCKGCKTFFRRICVSNEEIKCKFSDDCFDLTKRNQLILRCQSCRYKKCIEVGMNPLALELKEGEDESLNFKNVKKQEKEKKKQEELSILSLRSKENLATNIIESLIHLDLRLDQFKNSVFNPSFSDYQKSLEEMITCMNKLEFVKFLVPMQGWPLTQDISLPKVSRMRDIPDIFRMNVGSIQVPVPHIPSRKMWMMFNMMTTIEYAKTFKFFNHLQLEDKIVLIGHVALVCMNLHNSYFAVSKKMQMCIHPDGTEQPKNDEYHYPMVSMSFAPLIRCDIQLIEYLLLKAICLCNPTVHGLSQHAQEIISEERQKYADVLLDHCLRNTTNGPNRFVELLGIISVLIHQQRFQKDIHIYHISPIIAKFPHTVMFLEEVMSA